MTWRRSRPISLHELRRKEMVEPVPAGSETPGNAPPAHWGFWGTLLWAALVGIVFYVLQGGVVLVFIAARNTEPISESALHRLAVEAAGNGTLLAYATFVTTLICGALVVG